MKRGIFAISIALIVVLAGIVVYYSMSNEKSSMRGITIIDMAGREVTVPKNVQRVICLGPSALRIVVYLNATDLVVGVEDAEKYWDITGRPYRLAHPELANLTSIARGGPDNPTPYAEEIVKLKPDVIIASFVSLDVVNNLQEQTGIPVVVLWPSSDDLNKFFEALRIAGKVLNRERRAEDLIKYINDIIQDIKSRVKGVSYRPSVYVGGLAYKGAHGFESTSGNYLPFVLLNANNVASSAGNGTFLVNKEQIFLWNPEYVFIDALNLNLVMNDIMKNPEFYNAIKAFSDNHVYLVWPNNFYGTNLEIVFINCYAIGKVLYPNRFSDVNIREKANEILERFVGRPLYNILAAKFGSLVEPLGVQR
ncbi:MAG TPA: iron ABC transporter substrate-binding protein [Euryarchaeota archaeon]|nr:iron ABC transporter substrate-binding protein [Euryarchaeota archaeon]